MNLRDLFLRIRALVAPHCVERELHEELTFHIERETQKHIAAGLSPVHARTRALARFGAVPLAADQCRDARNAVVFARKVVGTKKERTAMCLTESYGSCGQGTVGGPANPLSVVSDLPSALSAVGVSLPRCVVE